MPDLDRLDTAQTAALMAVAHAYKERFAALEKAAREELAGRGGKGGTAVVDGHTVGRWSPVSGTADRLAVTDPVRFGAWLDAHGFETVSAPLPPANAAGRLDQIVEDADGELPDGVTVRAGHAPTVRVSVDPDAMDALLGDSDTREVARLLPGLSDTEDTPPDPFQAMGL